MRKVLLSVLLTVLITLPFLSFSQGLTKASMSGRITDGSGNPLPGATVIAVHVPTGSQYGNVTGNDGYFRISNMQVGGPYKVTVSFVGYEDYSASGLTLALGQNYQLNVKMKEESTQLEEVTVTANKSDIFDKDRTGNETVVGEQLINSTPTVSRSISDFARLNPYANISEDNNISLNGMNNRYNAIYIDGAVNNDVFGLAGSGTNGGQTGVSPISLDAIEQFQVSLAPYDVRQSGFAGGAINAVTRSGTNEFTGSAYYLFRNENLAGKTPTDDETLKREKLAPFTAKTYGARIGGPIIKDKLFFFANAEIQRDETPQPFNFSDYEGDATQAQVNQVADQLKGYGYDPGGYLNNTAYLNSEKLLAKIDWNINKNNKLSVRHSYVQARNLQARRSSSRSINFLNSSVFFKSITNSSSLELNSILNENVSNHLSFGATLVRDDRDPSGANFPGITIRDGKGSLYAGSEVYSSANQLNQDVYTLTDNLEVYKGKHTFTFGTHNEFYKVYNLFIRRNFGAYDFNSLTDFFNENPSRYQRSYSLVDDVTGDGSKAAAEFNGYQLGFYAQDEYQATQNLKITGGLRLDIPIFPDNPRGNQDFVNNAIPAINAAGYDLKGAKPGQFIDPQFLISPRVGFNWNVKGDNDLQLRGGVGIFTSRVPLVWPGGQYVNNGLTVGEDYVPNPNFFITDWQNQPRQTPVGGGTPSGQIDLFAKDFKVPQVLKASIAADKKLPFGLVGTAEVLFNKTLNNIYVQNVNVDPTHTTFEGADNRNYYVGQEVDPTYSGIYLVSNTNKGYTWNASFTLARPFSNGFYASASYSYGDAYSIFDGTSSQNSSQWNYRVSTNGRNVLNSASRSDFSMGNRIVAQVSYQKEYLNHLSTKVSLFYNGQSGSPYSYTYYEQARYSEMVNEWTYGGNNLIYIPKDESEITFGEYNGNTNQIDVYSGAQKDAMWKDLNDFIENDKYLKDHRGEYADRNSNRTPFTSIVDLRIAQDVFTSFNNGRKQTLEATFDIFNFTNMLNKNWGRRYYISNGNYSLIDYVGSVDSNNNGRPEPVFNYSPVKDNKPWSGNVDDSGIQSSRWQMQIGLRYTF